METMKIWPKWEITTSMVATKHYSMMKKINLTKERMVLLNLMAKMLLTNMLKKFTKIPM